jgi:hypothetical protein
VDHVVLTDLEHELLELCSMAGDPTTVLDEEMLEDSPGRATVERALRDLLARGLLSTKRGVSASGGRVYEDDWWDVTPAGREAIGRLPQAVGVGLIDAFVGFRATFGQRWSTETAFADGSRVDQCRTQAQCQDVPLARGEHQAAAGCVSPLRGAKHDSTLLGRRS